MKRKAIFFAKKRNKKNKLTKKDWKNIEEYGSVNPTGLGESEEEETLSKYVVLRMITLLIGSNWYI
jgi:hypothetical protein